MKNLEINWKEILGKRGMSLVLATTMAMGLSGCGKKAECNVEGNHAHLYISEDNFSRYLEEEYLTYEGYERQDDYILIDGQDEKLRKFEDKKNLLKIDENIDTIREIESKNHDYLEYRYSYMYMMPIPHHVSTGKSSYTYFTYIPLRQYSWTTDANHSNLTGEQRRCHHVYQAYNVVKDENGKYVLVPSESVDSIEDLNGEYTYIKEDFCKVVDAEYGYDLDYEDGAPEDPDLVIEDDENVTENSGSFENQGTEKVYKRK